MEQENKSIALNSITFHKIRANSFGWLNYCNGIRNQLQRYKFSDSRIQT
jgi:hypothetical protein